MAAKPTYEKLEKRICELESLALAHEKKQNALFVSKQKFDLQFLHTPLAVVVKHCNDLINISTLDGDMVFLNQTGGGNAGD